MKKRTLIDTEVVWKKINGTLTKEESQLFDQWVEENEEHRSFFEKALKFFKEGSSIQNEPLNLKEDWQKLDRRFEEMKSKQQVPLKSMMAVAAAISLLVVGFFVVNTFSEEKEIAVTEQVIPPGESKATLTLDNGSTYTLTQEANLNIRSGGTRIKSDGVTVSYIAESGQETLPSVEFNTLKIPRGGEFYVELSDGTKVWINAESSLKYPVQFLANKRTVELIGEAYFEVASDKSKPFIVKSGVQEIEVVGTAFNLTAYDDDDVIVTTLIEGEVIVRPSFGEQISKRLLPNQQSNMTRATGNIMSKDVDPNQFIAWKTGRFYFENASLSEIMKVLSRWYDIDVFFDNSEKTLLEFSGGFERSEDFDQIRRIIESTEEVEFTIKENTVIIK